MADPNNHRRPAQFDPKNSTDRRTPPATDSVRASAPPGMTPAQPPRAVLSDPWTEMLRRHSFGVAMPIPVTFQDPITPPGNYSPIAVQVEYTPAISRAVKQRRRSTVSVSCKLKKKRVLTKEVQELLEQKRETEREMKKIMEERDFYRDERDRLRDIVSRTPSISKLAAGPPTPILEWNSPPTESVPLLPPLSSLGLPKGEQG